MRIILYPYIIGSASAKALQRELRNRGRRCIRVRPDGNYIPRRTDLIINWGAGLFPRWFQGLGLGLQTKNLMNNVQLAQDKLASFAAFVDATVQVQHPPYTTHIEEANRWLSEGSTVLCRTLLRGSGGRGITMVTPGMAGLIGAPLYVKYIKKRYEYRIHVFGEEVIDVQQKKRINDFEGRDNQIRNHANGWVFSRNEIIAPDASILSMAVAAVNALGLDFGAVDIIWNQRQNQGYVLEVNTAPGLEGTTIINYANAIEKLL